MIGIVLAAGEGSRLYPLTENKPKTLLDVAPGQPILGLALDNLADVGLHKAVIVTGDHRGAIDDWLATNHRNQLAVEVVATGRDSSWNNAFSLWSARAHMRSGAIVANGDTVHPPEVTRKLMDDGGAERVTLAVDPRSALGAEAMKVVIGQDGRIGAIGKHLLETESNAEYIGVCHIGPGAVPLLVDSLAEAFQSDKNNWYEGGFQRFADAGGALVASPIPEVSWIEVDTHDDLAAARSLEWINA